MNEYPNPQSNFFTKGISLNLASTVCRQILNDRDVFIRMLLLLYERETDLDYWVDAITNRDSKVINQIPLRQGEPIVFGPEGGPEYVEHEEEREFQAIINIAPFRVTGLAAITGFMRRRRRRSPTNRRIIGLLSAGRRRSLSGAARSPLLRRPQDLSEGQRVEVAEHRRTWRQQRRRQEVRRALLRMTRRDEVRLQRPVRPGVVRRRLGFGG